MILGIGFLSSIYGIYAPGAVIPEDWPVEARGLVIGLSIGIAEAIAGAYKDGSKLFKTLVRDYVPGKFMSLTGPYLQWAARRRYFVVPYAVTWLLYGCRGNRHGPARRRPTCRRSLARATPATAAIRLAVVFLSALVGFPPFFVVSLAAGALGVEFRRFFAAGAIGRLVHFTVVACIPELLWRAF